MRMLASILFGILAIIFLVVAVFCQVVLHNQTTFILGLLVSAVFVWWPLVDLFQHFRQYCEDEIASSPLAHNSD